MLMPKLTKSFVEGLRDPGYVRDTELRGLCVRVIVAKTGLITRTYLVNTKAKGTGKNVSVVIGKHGVISLEQARIEAKRILLLMAQGINPNEQKQEERQKRKREAEAARLRAEFEQVTLSKLLKDYLEAHQLKDRTARDYSRFLGRCVPDWLPIPVASITRDMIQARHLEMTQKFPAQANYTMRILRALFAYAIATYDDHTGRALITVNPVDRLKHARLWNKVPRRQRVIRMHQLESWYSAVSTLQNDTARDVLLLELFTGLRQGEAMGLQWRNVDFAAMTLTAEDTKNREHHMLPMSSHVAHLLKARWNNRSSDDYVFPGPGRLGRVTDIRDSIGLVVEKSGVCFSEHDLRRTFETTAESLDVSYYTLKRLLNHKTGNDPTAGYIVTSAERMREAAQKIANHLAEHMLMPTPTESLTGHKLRLVK